MRKNKIFYSLNIEDIQNVAEQVLDRELTDEEIKKVIPAIEDNIGWYEAIKFALISQFEASKKKIN